MPVTLDERIDRVLGITAAKRDVSLDDRLAKLLGPSGLLTEKASPSSMPTEQELYEQELQKQLQERSGWMMDYLPGPVKDVASAAVGYASDMAGVGLRGSAATENLVRGLIPDKLEGAAGFALRTALPGIGQAVLPKTPAARKKLDLANDLQRTSEKFDEAVNKARGDGTIGWARKMGTGALRSGSTMLTGFAAGGPLGSVLLGGGVEASQKYGELEMAGKSEAEQLGWSAAAGVWESTVGHIMNKLGLGGVQKTLGELGEQSLKQLWKMPLKQASKEVLKIQGQEIGEELVTETGHLGMRYADGTTKYVSPEEVLWDVLRTWRDTAAQTAIMTGGVQAGTQAASRAAEKRDGTTPFGPDQTPPAPQQTPPAAPVTPQTHPARPPQRGGLNPPTTPRPIPREELEAIRAKGPVSRKDAIKAGVTGDQLLKQDDRTKAVDDLLEKAKEEAVPVEAPAPVVATPDVEVSPGLFKTYDKANIPSDAAMVSETAVKGERPYWEYRLGKDQGASMWDGATTELRRKFLGDKATDVGKMQWSDLSPQQQDSWMDVMGISNRDAGQERLPTKQPTKAIEGPVATTPATPTPVPAAPVEATPEPPKRKFLTSGHVESEFSIPAAELDTMREAGDITGYRDGTQYRYRREDVEAAVAKRAAKPATPEPTIQSTDQTDIERAVAEAMAQEDAAEEAAKVAAVPAKKARSARKPSKEAEALADRAAKGESVERPADVSEARWKAMVAQKAKRIGKAAPKTEKKADTPPPKKRNNDIIGKEATSVQDVFAESNAIEEADRPKTYAEAVEKISARAVMSPRDMRDKAKLDSFIKITWGIDPPESAAKPPKKRPVKNVAEAVKRVAAQGEQEVRGTVSEAPKEDRGTYAAELFDLWGMGALRDQIKAAKGAKKKQLQKQYDTLDKQRQEEVEKRFVETPAPAKKPARKPSSEMQAAQAEKTQAGKDLLREARKLKSFLPGAVNPELALAAVKYLKAAVKLEYFRFKDFVKYVISQSSKERALELDEYLQAAWKQQGAKDARLDKPSSVQALLGKKAKPAPKAEKPAPKSNWQDSVLSAMSGKTKPTDVVAITDLWDQVQKAHPDLTMDEFKRGLIQMYQADQVKLEPYTRAWADVFDNPLAIKESVPGKTTYSEKNGDGLLWFVRGVEKAAPVESPVRNPEPPPRKEVPKEEPGPETTGTKHRKTDELRAEIGMQPRPKVVKEKATEWEEEAARRIAADPNYVPDLVSRLIIKPFSPDKIENAALGQYIQALKNRRDAGEDVLDDMADAVLASTVGGTEAGRNLASRVGERYSDFSLAGLIGQHIDRVGDRPNEEMLAKLEEMADKIAKQDAVIEELSKRATEEEIDARIEEALKNVRKPTPEKKGTRKERLKKQASEAVSAFKSAWNEALKATGGVFTSGGLNPEAIGALGRAAKAAAGVVKAYIELGVNSSLEFFASVKRDIGDLTEDQTKLFREEWDKAFAGMESPLGENPTDPMIGALARDLMKSAVEMGIQGRENVIDAVHAELQRLGVEQTRWDTMKAMSGYGSFQELPADQVSVTVRGYRGEIQKLMQLHDITEGRPPLRTGQERGEQTEDARQIQKDVNEAKKKGGYTVTDPKRQLTSALQTAKTAVDNAITDTELAIKNLKEAIANHAPLAKPEERAPVPSDDQLGRMRKELDNLRAQRKQLRSEYDAIFPAKRGALTDARRLKMAEALLKRLNDQLEADITAGNLDPKQPKAPLTSPTLEAGKQRRAELKAALKAAREASPEYQAKEAARQNTRYKQTLERQAEFWQKRLDDALQGIVPAKRKPTPVDEEILEKRYQNEKLKRQAQAEIEEVARQKRGKVAKTLGFGGDLLDLSRLIMTAYEMSAVLRQGAYYTLGFPLKALPAVKNSVLAAFSRRADFALHDKLMQRPNHRDYIAGNLETTADEGPLSSREEMFRSRIASQLAQTKHWALLPLRWAAEGALGSERAFRSFSNTMRADLFDHMKAAVEASRPGTWTEEDAKIIGNASNIFGGRAPMKHGVAWGRVFFAPSWVWSRAQLIVGAPAWKGDKATRLAVGKVYVRAALGMAAFHVMRHFLYSLLAGDDEDKKPKYEPDMRSSDFGKMRLGETRLDSGTGVNQLLTLAARLITGTTKNTKGEIVPIRGEDVPFTGSDAREILHRFLDTKLAPLPSAVLDWIAGENVVGEKATVGKIVTERMTPMTWSDIWDAEKELNVPQGTVAAIEAFFGTGISTYGPKTKYRDASPEARKEQFDKYLEKMTWDAPDPAYTEFLTPDQMERVKKTREKKQGNLIFDTFRDPIEAKDYKDAEGLQKAQERLQQARASFDVLKGQISLVDAEKALAVHVASTMDNPQLTKPGDKDETGYVYTEWLPSRSNSKNKTFTARRLKLREAYGK